MHPLFERPACSCQMLSVVVRPNAAQACPDPPAMLHASPRLEYLDVTHASFDNFTADRPRTSNACRLSRAAVAALSGHPHLVYLKVTWTQALGDFPLRDLPSLQFLDLTGAGITALPAAPGVWDGLPQLRTLIVDQNLDLPHIPAALLEHPPLDTVIAYTTAACLDPAYQNVTKVVCNGNDGDAVLEAFARAPPGICRPNMFENPTLIPMYHHCDLLAARRYPGTCIPMCQQLFTAWYALDFDHNAYFNATESFNIARASGTERFFTNWTVEAHGEVLECLQYISRCPRRSDPPRRSLDVMDVIVSSTLGTTTCLDCPDWPPSLPKKHEYQFWRR
uniref:Uncharacterized protein n=1 Tax=Eutreptiella gymnastica TaxID=73025 RepID=A0A6T1YD65_9EUGL|mmetsp:Transcript_83205/g.138826  ORF Transcript_83205/g.138826 Transcript_83205/m.138826 type:complete len:335 (+) Transcript_83205:91-1095(+)